jgi:glycerol-3-phosphate dehydrogenase subunit B
MYDVIVMGAGLAGLMAAAAAAELNKKVLVVAKGRGNLYSASGYIDFLGYYPTDCRQPLENVVEALEDMVNDNPQHPYALLGKEKVDQAFDFFLKIMNRAGYSYSGSWKKNRIYPTAAGALAPTSLVPQRSCLDLASYQEILVVGFREMLDFYPFYAADNLREQFYQHGEKKLVRAAWLDLGLSKERELNSYDLAVALEDEAVRFRLAEQLRVKVSENTLVILPAVLGIRKWARVQGDLERMLACTFLEIPTLPPSVTGMRLAESLMEYLEQRGVEFQLGYPVTGALQEGKKCTGIKIETASGRVQVKRAQSYVLATGGILGGGLKVKPGGITEEIFQIKIEMLQEMSNQDFFAPQGQPLSRTGIRVNGLLQPVGAQGEPLLTNVFAAGKNLTGYDPFVEKSGNGVALVSGCAAGWLAGKGAL